MDEQRTLANGEVWVNRGFEWHMVGYDEPKLDAEWEGDYGPVSVENFESYAECIEAGERRSPKLN